jgi:hypothetical protein
MRALNPFEYFIAESPYSAPESPVDSNDSPAVNFWQFGPPWGASPCGGEDEEKSRPSGDNYPDTGGPGEHTYRLVPCDAVGPAAPRTDGRDVIRVRVPTHLLAPEPVRNLITVSEKSTLTWKLPTTPPHFITILRRARTPDCENPDCELEVIDILTGSNTEFVDPLDDVDLRHYEVRTYFASPAGNRYHSLPAKTHMLSFACEEDPLTLCDWRQRPGHPGGPGRRRLARW